MNEREAIAGALAAAGECARVMGTRDLSGGCIHRVLEVAIAGGKASPGKDSRATLVAKVARPDQLGRLEEEAYGLAALAATATVLVPRPLAVGVFGESAVLLMSSITAADINDVGWRRFGHALAALHGTDAGSRYGFDADNHLGTTPQPNPWTDDWVAFNAEHRFGGQIELARRGGGLDGTEINRLERLVARLGELLPRRPRPALLHGDLWSGNAIPTRDADNRPTVAVIDPACSIGDGWADIAMMRLFGGFPAACLAAYAEAVDDRDDIETRITVYQLYHVLNHVNLFGRSYAGQAIAMAGALGF